VSFSDEEIAYLQSQPIARLATVNADGQPDVSWSWNLAGEPAGEKWYRAKRIMHR
jgi:predicted pyridoxine 5'-phosphate oxidase superfamily flavin-nucleotide-binding protein